MLRVGILGGGQLARLLCLAAHSIGFSSAVYAAEEFCPAKNVSQYYQGEFNDNARLNEFLANVDVVTIENENFSADFLGIIEAKNKLLPKSNSFIVFQDRLTEKKLFNQLNIPTNQFYPVDSYTTLQDAANQLGYPFVLKQRKLGYDGRGQYVIRGEKDITNFKDKQELFFIAEEWINYDREVSIVAARNTLGEISYYDICENRHENGILKKTQVRKADPMFPVATELVKKAMMHLNYVGVMTIEFFQVNQQLLANEVAPRVHNSGHWTMHGALTSQFENHIRAITGLALGSTDTVANVSMYNCIGGMPELGEVMKLPGAYNCDYLKTPRANRKLGHITLVDNDSTRFKNSEANLTELIKAAEVVDL
ncbi:MAG: 5-(carboxyamino)imidazole ribonucleotide synthase [Pseudomonadota bacterium]